MKGMGTMEDEKKTDRPDGGSGMEVAAQPETGAPGMGQVHNLQACGGMLHFESITETK